VKDKICCHGGESHLFQLSSPFCRCGEKLLEPETSPNAYRPHRRIEIVDKADPIGDHTYGEPDQVGAGEPRYAEKAGIVTLFCLEYEVYCAGDDECPEGETNGTKVMRLIPVRHDYRSEYPFPGAAQGGMICGGEGQARA